MVLHNEIMKQVIENNKKLKSCDAHVFEIDQTPERKIGKTWECSNCHGTVDSMAKAWYERGFQHGLHQNKGSE